MTNLNLSVVSVLYHSVVITDLVAQVGRHEENVSSKLKIIVWRTLVYCAGIWNIDILENQNIMGLWQYNRFEFLRLRFPFLDYFGQYISIMIFWIKLYTLYSICTL